jgi:hypothetical protein
MAAEGKLLHVREWDVIPETQNLCRRSLQVQQGPKFPVCDVEQLEQARNTTPPPPGGLWGQVGLRVWGRTAADVVLTEDIPDLCLGKL